MTSDLFTFDHRPYSATPNVQNYVPFESIEGAIDSVLGNVRRGAGAAVVIGPAGLGKTMMCQVLSQRLSETYEVVMLATSSLCTRRALLQNILFELGLPYRDRDEGELRLGLLDHLRSRHNESSGMVMIVDEAQTMPPRLLEEVRVLSNITREGRPRVHLVFAGNQSFDERLNNPKLDAIQQRISTRCYLYPMSREETTRFVTRQWTQATAHTPSPLPFSTEAVKRIHEASEGIPRLINQVCDHALMLANARRIRQVGDDLIQETWSDLQQLPTPWQVNHRETPLTLGKTPPTIIEFGSLDSSRPWPDDDPSVSSIERSAFSRLDELEQMTEDALQGDQPSANEEGVAPSENSQTPANSIVTKSIPPQVARIIDPFADQTFDQEEWVSPSRTRRQPVTSAHFDSDLSTTSASQTPASTEATDNQAALDRIAATLGLNNESSSTVAALSGLPASPSLEFSAYEGSIDSAADEVEQIDPQFVFQQEPVIVDPFAQSEFDEEEALEAGPQRVERDAKPKTASARLTQLASQGLIPVVQRKSADANEVEKPQENAPSSSAAPSSQAGAPSITSVSKSTDDRDLIHIEDPVPQANFRIVSASISGLGAQPTEPPMGTAFREDYRTLFSRLRGDSQHEA